VSRVVVGQYEGEAPKVPAEPPAADDAGVAEATAPPPPVAHAEGEPSLDDIISRAEAQEALFPAAFEEDSRDVPKK
jgi:hypothetical protein